ncbi:hypothetical protein FOMPIDRAFT_1031963 [Fomitopsis schrenkii]|uniref:Endonuclease/exonuclease/phosphatase domain-containing protein n=1 Tax=Fomitopsis schrenkii TaxID=2126942 RepID=S8F7G0_FOMSC|nr:hypothetical protein FOMPIDRAFT_1031963 [Fomitopsis schrenkii]
MEEADVRALPSRDGRTGRNGPRRSGAADHPGEGHRRRIRFQTQSSPGNIRGTGSKWGAVNQSLREERMGILMIQETHLSEEDIGTIQEVYGRRIHIINSPDPTSPTTTNGVAIVLNRELVDTSDVQVTEVIKGRALMIKTKWHAGASLRLMNVYAPNQASENKRFWEELEGRFARSRLPKPEIMAGDFNLVEEAIDRLPTRKEHDAPLLALKTLRNSLQLHDGWRLTNPTTKAYSYPQRGSEVRSRIDRIYVSDDLLSRSIVWKIQATGVPTDHNLVTTQLTAAHSPYIGKGRWTMPLHLLEDQTFMDQVASIGEKMLDEASDHSNTLNRSQEENPQTALKKFKDQVRDVARERLKTKIPKMRAEIRKLTKARDATQGRPDFTTDRQAQEEASILQDRILELERRRHRLVQLATTTHYNLNAEQVSKYWSAINRERKPRDIFFSLKKPESDTRASQTPRDRRTSQHP